MPKNEQVTFAAGCFWGVEATFSNAKGVRETLVGYTGGTLAFPSYEQVCSGRTGHAEAVLITYAPEEITFDQLLDVFWNCHNPTQRDAQGPDIGTQYRSEIFFHTRQQEEEARASLQKEQNSDRHRCDIATRITQASEFFPAEEYHQNYFAKQRH